MQGDILYNDIKNLKAVSDKKAKVLEKELGITTYRDLLYHFPYRYVDRSKYYTIAEICSEDTYVQIVGKIISKEIVRNGNTKRLVVGFADHTGKIELVFFKGLQWIEGKMVIGMEYVIFGKPSSFNKSYNFVHPEIEERVKYESRASGEKYIPIYSTTERMKNAYLNTKGMANLTHSLLQEVANKIQETLPQYIISQNNLLSLNRALIEIHYPSSPENLNKAKFRLKFEELFFLQLEHIIEKNQRVGKSKGFVFSKIGNKFNTFYSSNLPFSLTNAQKRVIKEIRNDMRSGHQMNRLLQGDVGSGKTLVALMSMLIAIDNGYQAALLAPTEILSQQHFNSICKFLKGLNINVALLLGSIKGKTRKNILTNLAEGAIDIIIGTHALLEDSVQFKNLGLAVIDEQHRFGVEQRSKMWRKNNDCPPHVLVMTATPIPRTLAMTAYGDLDYSVIDELPPGRKPIQTVHLYDRDILKMYSFMHKQIAEGRQIYIVYPLINESEKLDIKDLMDGYESIVREFPLPQYQISIVHGQMKNEDKDYEMQRFAKGITHIMVATTVIEVGVDVSNATVMIIENSERFGLSQLHQLRGRVGRGANQSYCLLRTKDNLSKESAHRIEVMCQSNDGFVLAEEDLKMRGPGSISGTAQSGVLELKIADIVKDEPLVRRAREFATAIVNNDPNLSHPDNALLKEYIIRQHPIKDFSNIS